MATEETRYANGYSTFGGADDASPAARRQHSQRCGLLLLTCAVAVAALIVGSLALHKATNESAPGPLPLLRQARYSVTALPKLSGHTVVGATEAADGAVILFAWDNAGTLWSHRCVDYVCTSTTASKLATPDGVEGSPAVISVFGEQTGMPYVAFVGGRKAQVARCSNVRCTSATLTNTGSRMFTDTVSGVLDPNTGFPILVGGVTSSSTGNVATITCNNADCSSSTYRVIPNAPAFGTGRVTAAVSPKGEVVLAWTGPYVDASPRQALTIGVCGTGCANVTGVMAVPGTTNVTAPQLLFPPGGGLIASYFNNGATGTAAGAMHLTRCATTGCFAADSQTVQLTAAATGPVALWAAGAPTFVTLDADSYSVQVTRCPASHAFDNSPCVGASRILDAAPGMRAPGVCTPGDCMHAFASRTSGFPVVVVGGYEQVSILRCSNDYCVPFADAQRM